MYMQKKITITNKLITTIVFEILHYTILYLAYIPFSAVVLISFIFCVIPTFSLLQSGEKLLSLNPLLSSLLELILHQEDKSYNENDILLFSSKLSFIFSSIAVVFQYLTKKKYSTIFSFSNKKKIMFLSIFLTVIMIISQLTILNTGTTELIGILIFFWALALICYLFHLFILWFAKLFSLLEQKILTDNFKF